MRLFRLDSYSQFAIVPSDIVRPRAARGTKTTVLFHFAAAFFEGREFASIADRRAMDLLVAYPNLTTTNNGNDQKNS
jgi:hypothetical protein